MKTHTITTYGINELSEEARKKALDNNRDWNLEFDWWEPTYEDATRIGLKITSSDTYRGDISGEFIDGAEECASLILKEHGEMCETYKLAKTFLAEYHNIPFTAVSEDKQDLEDEKAETRGVLEEQFLDDLLRCYLKMLKDQEDHLSSDESLIEAFESNELEFLENGTRY